MFNPKEVGLEGQQLRLELLVVHTDVILEKEVGVTVGIQVSILKKEFLPLMTL